MRGPMMRYIGVQMQTWGHWRTFDIFIWMWPAHLVLYLSFSQSPGALKVALCPENLLLRLPPHNVLFCSRSCHHHCQWRQAVTEIPWGFMWLWTSAWLCAQASLPTGKVTCWGELWSATWVPECQDGWSGSATHKLWDRQWVGQPSLELSFLICREEDKKMSASRYWSRVRKI